MISRTDTGAEVSLNPLLGGASIRRVGFIPCPACNPKSLNPLLGGASIRSRLGRGIHSEILDTSQSPFRRGKYSEWNWRFGPV